MPKSVSALFGVLLLVAACGESTQNMSLQKPPPAPPPPTKAWMVFFDTNSTALSQQSSTTIGEAAGVAKGTANARVVVTGFTDTDGNPAYNQQLSLRRANAVKNALVNSGVAPQAVTVTGSGESGLLIDTPDQTKNEKNRRVQIVVQ
ncbi:MAG: OmpA family protein [Reyranella sp.]|nr:OmpA family protein [Reyranella sp.]